MMQMTLDMAVTGCVTALPSATDVSMYAAYSRCLLAVVHCWRQPILSTNVLVAYTFSPMSAAPRNITISLRNLGDALPGWRVAPLNSTDGSQHSWTGVIHAGYKVLCGSRVQRIWPSCTVIRRRSQGQLPALANRHLTVTTG